MWGVARGPGTGYPSNSFIPRPKGVGVARELAIPALASFPGPRNTESGLGMRLTQYRQSDSALTPHTQKVTYVLQLQDREQLSATCGEKVGKVCYISSETAV